jgi:preprotein translocase subunit SecE
MGRLKRKKTSAKKKVKATASEKALASQSQPADKAPAPPPKPKAAKASGAKKVLSLKRSSKPAKVPTGKQNIIDKSLQFLREVRVELKKVTWPSRKQAIGSTVVVLILTMIISLFLGVVDVGLSSLIRVILN